MAYRSGKEEIAVALKYLLDTNVIIWHLRDYEPTNEILRSIKADQPMGCSAISVFEVWVGVRKKEYDITQRLLNQLYKIPIDSIIAIRAAEYWREFRAKGITLGQADAIIAATANILNLTLITYNQSHYPMDDIAFYELRE
jgi:tRNA(fMet)-specific endonuclease VapC